MQEHAGITFDPVRHTSVLHPWEIVLAVLLFAGLIYFAVWRARRRSNERESLDLRGK